MVRYLAASCLATLIATSVAAAEPQTVLDQAEAQRIGAARGWVIREESPDGRVRELRAIFRGRPMYYVTHNLDAADSLSTDECWPGGESGLDLSGAGVTLGIWDAGSTYVQHPEFEGRAVQRDSADPNDPDDLHYHATHVAGTMIGSGYWPGNDNFPAGVSKGMSWAASLDCYYWDNDNSEMAAAAEAGLRVSNHSYGFGTGWEWSGDWYWYGDVTVSETEDTDFGRYSYTSAEWDEIAHEHPYYLIVDSAGNDRNDTGPEPGEGHYYFDLFNWQWTWSTATREADGGDDGFDCASHYSISKNLLTVGATKDVRRGYSEPDEVEITSFSSWGPADDGRIKPDVCGNGYQLFSAYWHPDYPPPVYVWNILSGTSMSSPNVSGSLGLLIEHWRATHPGKSDMLSSTLKALAIHTADECGEADGPDYSFGWGLVNTLHAAQTISADGDEPLTITQWKLFEDSVPFKVTITTAAEAEELRATLCWTDPPGTPPDYTLNNREKVLVVDMDLRIESDAQVAYLPWVLDVENPAAAATTGDNDTDNVEQIVIKDPGEGTFTLRVTYKGALQNGEQNFSLIITGAETLSGVGDCNDNLMIDADELRLGLDEDCNGDGVLNQCEHDNDADNLVAGCDNCPDDYNADQTDSDTDGAGDACDNCEGLYNPEQLDDDQDDLGAMCDNCPDTFNPDQVDTDGDGWGDDCDSCPLAFNPDQLDQDDDGTDDACDACPDTPNVDQADEDADGVGNVCDNCLYTANGDQADADGDGEGDACDNCLDTPNRFQTDEDFDGIGDLCDNCQRDANVDQLDSDGDGWGDACDNCPDAFNPDQADTDRDGFPDACDTCPDRPNLLQDDSDGDGIGDLCDNCPDKPNPDQADADGDGVGDACEPAPESSSPNTDDQTGQSTADPVDMTGDTCGLGSLFAMPLTLAGLSFAKLSGRRRRRR